MRRRNDTHPHWSAEGAKPRCRGYGGVPHPRLIRTPFLAEKGQRNGRNADRSRRSHSSGAGATKPCAPVCPGNAPASPRSPPRSPLPRPTRSTHPCADDRGRATRASAHFEELGVHGRILARGDRQIPTVHQHLLHLPQRVVAGCLLPSSRDHRRAHRRVERRERVVAQHIAIVLRAVAGHGTGVVARAVHQVIRQLRHVQVGARRSVVSLADLHGQNQVARICPSPSRTAAAPSPQLRPAWSWTSFVARSWRRTRRQTRRIIAAWVRGPYATTGPARRTLRSGPFRVIEVDKRGPRSWTDPPDAIPRSNCSPSALRRYS